VSAHSPGPWRVGRKVGRTIYDDDRLIGVMDTVEDARLAAAAPELLEALKSALHRERELANLIGAACTGSVHEAAAALIARIEAGP